MNQTKKRLSIINLAISIGDTETIQLQILKLAPLKRDEKIQEIIHGLQAENYAQTQALITDYIKTAPDEIHQRAILDTPHTSEEEEESIIKEFDLFRIKPETDQKESDEILNIEEMEPSAKNTDTNETDFDALLNLKSEEVLPDTPEIPQTLADTDDFFDLPEEKESYDYTELVEKDDFFFQETDTGTPPHVVSEETDDVSASTNKDSVSSIKKTEAEIPETYEPIPYIDQKLKNMLTQYPTVEESDGNYPAVDAWMKHIAGEAYTEQEVEEMITHINKLAQEGRKAEAALLLLVSAATKSKFAQFILARELYKGTILQRNLPEAFTLINHLAMEEDYAEAICDLGQFYEHGIGIDKDKKRAEELYKEATELGINRAKAHYERLKKENRGLFSFLKK